MWPHVRAGLLLLAHLVMLVMAAPVLDAIGHGWLDSERERAQAAKIMPRAAVDLAATAIDADKALRMPVVRFLTPLQRPLRLEQTWRLYGDGASKLRHMEIRVDGDLVFLNGDADKRWRAAVWTNRRIRPVCETSATKPRAPNRKGLVRLVVREALEDWPDAQEVRLTFTHSPFPARAGQGEVRTVSHHHVARAPDWQVGVELESGP